MKKPKPDTSYRKTNLPTKLCEYCAKPMTWRKRWAKVWHEVKFCSERCRRAYKNSK
ncbi:MAG: DUF2256 domain-containing protein [Pyrinomonadaceae bacterium]